MIFDRKKFEDVFSIFGLISSWIEILKYIEHMCWFSSVQFSHSLVSELCDLMNLSRPDLPVHHQLLDSLKLMSIGSAMPSNRLILCSPLLLLPSVFPSIMVFSNESILPQVAKQLELELQH